MKLARSPDHKTHSEHLGELGRLACRKGDSNKEASYEKILENFTIQVSFHSVFQKAK